MTTIRTTTRIRASVERTFELSLDIDLEREALSAYGMRAIGGCTAGMIAQGERVRWSLWQFGVPVTHTTEITRCEPPVFFEDAMVQGIFRTFRHEHRFEDDGAGGTVLHDELAFSMPAYLLGVLSERLLIARRLNRLLHTRNATIKRWAESGRTV